MAEVFEVADFAPDLETVKVLINGEYSESYPAGSVAGDLISEAALDAGFKRFTVLLDGEPFAASRKGELLEGGSVLDIIAKDDRA